MNSLRQMKMYTVILILAVASAESCKSLANAQTTSKLWIRLPCAVANHRKWNLYFEWKYTVSYTVFEWYIWKEINFQREKILYPKWIKTPIVELLGYFPLNNNQTNLLFTKRRFYFIFLIFSKVCAWIIISYNMD